MKTSYCYNLDSFIDQELSETWQSIGNYGFNSLKTTNTFDVNNNLILQIIEEYDTTNNNWNNYCKVTNTYNSNNNLVLRHTEIWNPNTTTWVNNNKVNNTYVNNHLAYFLSEGWYSNSWINISNDTIIYDASYNILSDESKVWVSNTSWGNYAKTMSTYDINNNKTIQLEQSWVGTNWKNTYKSLFYANCNRPISTVGLKEINYTAKVSIFPSPATSLLSIEIADFTDLFVKN